MDLHDHILKRSIIFSSRVFQSPGIIKWSTNKRASYIASHRDCKIRFRNRRNQLRILRLLHVDPSANANQLYAVRLALPVNTEIAATPGMNATVEVAMRQETEASVEIPASALFSNGDKTSYVWIYRQDGTIARRRVEVVRLHTDGTATIADGLNEGERIVVAGVHKLTEGQRVAPLPAPSKTNEGGLL